MNNKSITTIGVFGAGSIGAGAIQILTWLFDAKEATDFCKDNPKFFIGSIIVLFAIIGFMITWIIKLYKEIEEITNSKNKEIEEITNSKNKEIEDITNSKNKEIENLNKECEKNRQHNLYEGVKPREPHTVLIVDDDNKVRKMLKDELDQGFNVLTLERIEDYRFASEFEIVVSDLFNCSPASTAESVLNMIKQKYPYKFVIPMSAQPAACECLNADSNIINKGNDYKFILQIRDKVVSLANELDNVDRHWKNVHDQLCRENKPEDQIEAIKSKYYRFVKNM